MTRTSLLLCSMLAALAFSATAQAQAPHRQHGHGHGGGAAPATPPPPTAEQTQAARTAYAAGQTAFHAGNFADALAQFNAAFAAVPNAVVLLSVAECQERLGQTPDAVATLQRYLTLRTDAPDHDAVTARITQMQSRPGTIAVTTDPSGAAISLDGTGTGRTSPADIEAPPGDHTLSATLAGHEDASQHVTVTFGTRQVLALTMPASTTGHETISTTFPGDDGTTTTTTVTPLPPVVHRGSGPPVATWIFGGVGVAALIGGTVLGFLALSDQSSYDAHPTAGLADEGGAFALGADICFGVAGAGLLTAIILLLVNGGGDEVHETAPAARLQLVPTVGPHHGGVSAAIQF